MSGFSLNLVLRHNRVSIRWHMTKLQIKSDRITSFGGIYFVNRLFDQFSLGKVINDTLGLRSTAHNGYQWDEIVKSLFDIYLCGSDHIEDITSLMPCLSQAPDSHVPSSDTIGRGIKQLATDNITYTAKNRPCREPRRQYAGKVLSGRNLETAVCIPAQTWAVHLPIPCRLRLLFERNRGNHRRAQQSVLSACVKLRERLYGICRAGRLENH